MSKWDIFAWSNIKRYSLAGPLTRSLQREQKYLKCLLQFQFIGRSFSYISNRFINMFYLLYIMDVQ